MTDHLPQLPSTYAAAFSKLVAASSAHPNAVPILIAEAMDLFDEYARTALAQQQREAVGEVFVDDKGALVPKLYGWVKLPDATKLYTHPPAQAQAGQVLTDE